MVRSEVLPNGMTLLIEESRAAPVTALALWVGAGAADEPPEHSGAFHFLEHMVLKTSDGGPAEELSRTVQDAGGYLNARTGYDHTALYQVVPAGHWRPVLEAQQRVVTRAEFRPEDVSSERSVVIEEAKMAERNPASFVWRKLMQGAMPDGGYGRPILGTEASLGRIDAGVLSSYFRREYAPPNMVQVVAGDVDADEVASFVRGLAERAGGTAAAPRDETHRAQTASGWRPYRAVFDGNLSVPYVVAAFRAPPLMHGDMPALDALSGLLGLGRSSRLRRSLVYSLGLAADVGSSAIGYRDTGLLALRAVGTGGASAADIVESLFAEVGRLRSEPVGGSEMAKGLRRLEAGYVLERETVETRAMSLGFFEVMGDHRYMEEYVDRLAAVTPEDVMRVVNAYLDVEAAAIAAYVPASGPSAVSGGAESAGETLTEAARRGDAAGGVALAAERSVSWGGGERFVRPNILREAQSPSFARVVLENGATLVVRQTTNLPLVSVAMGFRGGFPDEPEASSGLTSLTLKHMLRGSSSRSAEELADDVEGLGSGIAVSTDRDGFGIGSTVLSRHLTKALGIVGEAVSSPLLDPVSFDPVRAEALAEIGEAEDHPFHRTMRRLTPLLFPGHPYGRPVGGTRESISSIRADATAAWHAERFAASNLFVCVTGDVSPERAADALGEALVGLPSTAGPSASMASPPRPRGSVDEAHPRGGQSSVAVGFRGPRLGTPDAVAIHVVGSALTLMGGRLWEALRERPPYAYTVHATPVPLRESGAFIGYVTTPPGREEAAIETFVSEFGKLSEEGLSPDELRRGRRYLAGVIEISMQRGASRAASYAAAEVGGVGYERVDRLPELIRQVTNDDVVRVARLYLTAEDWPAVAILRG